MLHRTENGPGYLLRLLYGNILGFILPTFLSETLLGAAGKGGTKRRSQVRESDEIGSPVAAYVLGLQKPAHPSLPLLLPR